MAAGLRIPLVLNRVVAVIHRLDVAATRAFAPPGRPSGYSSAFRSPVQYDDATSGARSSSRRESAPVRVPCQMESRSFEQLRKELGGDVPASAVVLVCHRKDLARLALIDVATKRVSIRKGDRVSAVERFGSPVGTAALPLAGEGLYIFHVLPAGFGLGPDGYDLELLYCHERPEGGRS